MNIDKVMAGYHIPPVRRPWSPDSEPYTGTDSLFYALRCGWSVRPEVTRETLPNRRHIYLFALVRGTETQRMAVVESPHLLNFIRRANLLLIGGDPAPVRVPVQAARMGSR